MTSRISSYSILTLFTMLRYLHTIRVLYFVGQVSTQSLSLLTLRNAITWLSGLEQTRSNNWEVKNEQEVVPRIKYTDSSLTKESRDRWLQ